MARGFNGSDQYLKAGTAAYSTMPFTVAFWFYDETGSQTAYMFCISDTATDDYNFSAGVLDTSTAFQRAVDNSGGSTNAWSGTHTADAWHLIVLKYTSNSSRSISVDGSLTWVTDTVTIAPSGLDATAFGRLERASPTGQFSGHIAYAAIWDVALSDANVTSLWNSGNGTDPSGVATANLQHFWKFDEATGENCADSKGSLTLTDYNDSTLETDPFALAAAGHRSRALDGALVGALGGAVR